MVDVSRIEPLQEAAGRWSELDVRTLLAESAIAVGAGSPTDAGMAWTLPTEVEHPITMAGGIPDPSTLPAKDLRQALDMVLTTVPEEALRYGGVPGFEGLREALAERMSRIDGIPMTLDNFVITNGSAGGIDTVCDAFVEPGDVVVVEGPSFSGSMRTFRGHSAEIVQVPVDAEGIVVDKAAEVMERAKASGKLVKLVYVISDFHNPTGATMSSERRKALVRLCAEHQALIVEDAAYAEIYFGRNRPDSLYGLAGGQGVLKVGTYSKPIATGLRIGWVQGRADFIEALIRVKYDMGNSPLLQRALAEYVTSGKLDEHLAMMRPIYAEKCETLCRSLEDHCSQYLKFRRPDGGFFLWVECIGPKSRDVMQAAAIEGIIFPVGATFFINGDEDDTSHLRFAFSTATLDELAQVGPRLRKVFDKVIGER